MILGKDATEVIPTPLGAPRQGACGVGMSHYQGINFDHLAKVPPAGFLHCTVIFSPRLLFLNISNSKIKY